MTFPLRRFPGAAVAYGCMSSAGLPIIPGSQLKPNQESNLPLKESSMQDIGTVAVSL